MAAKDHRSARQMIVWALLFLAAVYFALTEIGLGLRILYPELIDRCATDDIFVYAVNNMMFSRFSGFFLLSVIGACISTANSQLLLIGSSLSYDVTNELAGRRLSEERLLNLTRLFIFIGGTAALLLSLNPPGDILLRKRYLGSVFRHVYAYDLRRTVLETGQQAGSAGSLFHRGGLQRSVLPDGPSRILGLSCHSLLHGSVSACFTLGREKSRPGH